MKTITNRLAPSVGILLLTLSAFCQPLPPPDPFLDGYGFQATNALSFFGDPPLAATNLLLVPEWDGNAVLIDSTNTTPVYLKYCVTTNDRTNISFSAGALELIFISCWASADTNQNGSGPGAEADLLAAGDTASGLWRLYVGASGTNIVFGGTSNSTSTVFVSAPISWPSNSIHVIGIDYNMTGSSIYLDGALAGTGNPVSIVPATNTWTNGFATGSDLEGYAQCEGILCRLELYDSNFSSEYDGGFFTNRWPYYSNLYASWLGGGSGPNSFPPVFNPMNDGACSNGGLAYITNLVVSLDANSNTMVSMDIQGGINGLFYDLYSTTNLAAASNLWQWTWRKQVLPCNSYVLSGEPSTMSFYRLAVPVQSMTVAFGDNGYGQCDVPEGLSNSMSVAAGGYFSLALQNNGTILAWGDNTYGQTNVPAGLTNVVSIAAGQYHGVALLADGAVTNWGYYWGGGTNFYPVTNYPGLPGPPTSNVMAIAAGLGHDLALMSNGTIVAWGLTNLYATFSNSLAFQSNLTGVKAIACGWNHNVALLSNGLVKAWGLNAAALNWNLTNAPDNLTNAVAIAAFGLHSLALRSNGTVEAWGYDPNGETNVPPGLSNVVAIATGGFQSLALQANGTVVIWGEDGLTNIPAGLIASKAISGGFEHNLLLQSDLLNPLILEEPTGQYALANSNVTFTAQGESLAALAYQWQFNGTNVIGATNAAFTLTNIQFSNDGSYQVIISTEASSITSSVASLTLIMPPQITSITGPAMSGTNWINSTGVPLLVTATGIDESAYPLHYQWSVNGTNVSGATNPDFALGLLSGQYETTAVTITNAAGSTNVSWGNFVCALPGMVEAWGADGSGECDRPVTLTNTTAIAAGDFHSVAVTDNGTVVQWGEYSDGTNFYPVGSPPSLTNAVAVAASRGHDLALKANGTVTNWGLTNDVANFVPTNLPAAKAIAAGWYHNIALLTNGSVTAWGSNSNGQTSVPSDLTNANASIAVAAGELFSVALRSNGTVEAWGDNTYGQTNVPAGLTGVVAIAAGGQHGLALNSNGIVVAWGNNDSGQTNVPSGMSNFMAIAAGSSHSLALVNDGTLIAWGDNSAGQTDIPSFSTNNPYKLIPGGLDPLTAEAISGTNLPAVPIRLITAGGDHSMVAIFSTFVQYPVDVSRDVLLIYNTNSPGSSNTCFYYMANRPMMSSANFLGVGCVTNSDDGYTPGFTPGINTAYFRTNVFAQIQSWLNCNPTKRPSYAVLFQDIPAAINGAGFSTQYELNRIGLAPWNLLVTSINMNGVVGVPDDCLAYVNKLVSMASNNPPGTLFISATAANYGNTNWYFDNYKYEIGGYALDGITNADPSALVFLSDSVGYPSTFIISATNVAGYYSVGVDGGHSTGMATNGEVVFTNNSGWYIMASVDSYNGERPLPNYNTNQSSFITWFAPNAFGGSNYSNAAVGAITHVFEPSASDDIYDYYGSWAAEKSFAISAYHSFDSLGLPIRGVSQAVGDPFVRK